MRLWDWALAAYARPGAEAACLGLQDDHGQNVPYLLWAVWAGGADPAALARAAGLARSWEAEVTGPLRGVRRALEPSSLRDEVKAVELSAERLLLETLEQVAPHAPGAPLAALGAASAAWGPPVPEPALKRLAAALS